MLRGLVFQSSMMLFAVLAGLASSASGAVIIFQEGVDSYAGTVDTYLRQAQPTTSQGSSTVVEWDHDDLGGTDQDNIGLLRFDNIFGAGPNQIPPGAMINSATLTYNVTNTGHIGTCNEVVVDWNESVTYNTFGGDPGVQADEYGTLIGSTSGSSGLQSVNVTISLANWSSNPSNNRGWVFQPTGTDGVAFSSREDATVSLRPKLTVDYILPTQVEILPDQIDAVVGHFNVTVSVVIPPGSNVANPVTVTLGTTDAAVAVPVGASGEPPQLDVTFLVGAPTQQNVNIDIGSAGSAVIDTTNTAGLDDDALTVNVGVGAVSFTPPSLSTLVDNDTSVTVAISDGSNDTRTVKVTLTTDNAATAVPSTGSPTVLTFLAGAASQQAVVIDIGTTGSASITSTNDGDLSDAALPVEVSEGFRFTVTADPRSEVTRWNRVLAGINTYAGGPGAFHVSCGDVDPLQPIRDGIDGNFGASAIWYPIVGNHEEETSADMAWIRAEYNTGNGVRTPLKDFTKQDGPATCVETTYSWDHGNALFIALNEYWDGYSDTGTNGDIVPALREWIADRLAATDKPVVFLFGHEPAYPFYRHVGDSLDGHPANRDAFWQLLDTECAQAYFCGHTHVYKRYQEPGYSPWQVDVGNAGNDSSDHPDNQVFADVTVTATGVRYDIWQSIEMGGTEFSKIDTWTVPIPLKMATSVTQLSHTIDRGSTLANDSFTVKAIGPGTVNYSISEGAAWLSVSPDVGDSAGEPDTIDVVYDVSGLPTGVHTAQVTVDSGDACNAPKTIDLTVTVEGPIIALSQSVMNRTVPVGENLPNDTFTVTNDGVLTLNYTIDDDVDWLSVSPDSGDSTGEPDEIDIIYDVAGLDPGPYAAHIDVSSGDADNSPQRLTVNLTVQGPSIVLDQSVINRTAYIGHNPDNSVFTVTNGGGGTLNYTISDDVGWLSVSPDSGDSTGEADPIDIVYDVAGLGIGLHTGHVNVASGDADPSQQTLTVNVTVDAIAPDFDKDGDVDLNDFGHFQVCLSGDGVAQNEPTCDDAKLDTDTDVDQTDFGIFRDCLTGAGVLADPACLP